MQEGVYQAALDASASQPPTQILKSAVNNTFEYHIKLGIERTLH